MSQPTDEYSPLSSTPFAEKVITITGGASGIGLATSLLLYSRGATISVSDINPKSLAELEQILQDRSATALPGQKWLTKIVDVAKGIDVQAWIDETVQKFGQLNYAANIAGAVHRYAPMAETTTEDFDFSFDVNTKGIYNSMRAQIPQMKPGSSIVNISSISATRTEPGISLYGAAKAAISTLTTAAASEYGVQGIRINAVAPGVTLSSRLLSVGKEYIEPGISATALKRGAQPIELARTIAFLLSDEASYITGTVLRCDGGALALQY